MTAASVRAGICRFTIYSAFQDKNKNPITAAPISGLDCESFEKDEQVNFLAGLCLKDMLAEYFQHIALPDRPQKVHFILGVSSEKRAGPTFDETSEETLRDILASYISHIETTILPMGNASVHYAIAQAARLIDRTPEMICVIGVIDSLLAESTLRMLEVENRLMSPSYGRNHSLVPSEAVSFLIIEDHEQAEKKKRPILAAIRSLGLADEPEYRASGKTGIGKGLTNALYEALKPSKAQDVRALLGDVNGETARHEEISTALTRSLTDRESRQHLWKTMPRTMKSYGDIGAASGGVLVCIAVHGFAGSWLPSPALIFCSDDFGPCGAMILEKDN